MAGIGRSAYEFRARLCGFSGRIERVFRVSGDTSLARLSYIVMSVFEMRGNYMFRIGVPERENFYRFLTEERDCSERIVTDIAADIPATVYYAPLPSADEVFADSKPLDATQIKIDRIFKAFGDRAVLEYDFRDGWEIEITFENICDSAIGDNPLPSVVCGEGYGIIEGCGGACELERIAAVCQNKHGEKYAELCKSLGTEELDLNKFDLDDLNRRIKKLPSVFAGIYERGVEPSANAQKLLDRR